MPGFIIVFIVFIIIILHKYEPNLLITLLVLTKHLFGIHNNLC